MKVIQDKCIGCADCMRNCPVEAIRVTKKKAVIDDLCCTNCGVCFRVCKENALIPEKNCPEGTIECNACPVKCWIHNGYLGACRRYKNEDGELVRLTHLHSFDEVKEIVSPGPKEVIRHPVITGIGAGTTYPDCKPAPYIMEEKRVGIDVVTVVTEVPLSYSSIILKIDTDFPIGKEGEAILVGKKVVGHLETEQYGSKMLHIGGVNRLKGENGFLVARTITDIANRKTVNLKIEKGVRLKVQVGQPPTIDGQMIEKMRVGCGSATIGIFAELFKKTADEVIIIDAHITGQLSCHEAGKFIGVQPTGISLKFEESTPGRYFGDHGDGWGGTSISNPADIIKHINMKIALPGMTILITEATGQNGAMFQIKANGSLNEIPLTESGSNALKTISETCEPSLVSAIYTGGVGGSARAGVVKYPAKLTKAVHDGKANLTVGGSQVFVLPGGGISFMADVQQVKTGAFYWTPTPATICPVEYTIEKKDYEKMGGHTEAMKPFSSKKPEKK
ncbi:MAG: 4Fe-4S binding protein [Desulfobacterales bacterium]|nr:4Fe-4S binding protein [Desulfobacterales bacterium]